MSASTKDQEPPDTVVELLDDLDAPTLRAVRTYVEQRLDELRSSLRERIRSEADGTIVDIEDRGAYTLIRKYPLSQGDSENSSQSLLLYRVKREKRPNGEETLHWSCLGDVTERSGVECENCGALMDTYRAACPHCGEGEGHHDEEV